MMAAYKRSFVGWNENIEKHRISLSSEFPSFSHFSFLPFFFCCFVTRVDRLSTTQGHFSVCCTKEPSLLES